MSEEYIKYLNDSPNLIFNDTAMEVSYAMAYLENKEVWDKLPDEEKSKKMKENFWEAYRMYLEDKVVTDFVTGVLYPYANIKHTEEMMLKASDGYSYGKFEDDEKKTTPRLIPFEEFVLQDGAECFVRKYLLEICKIFAQRDEEFMKKMKKIANGDDTAEVTNESETEDSAFTEKEIKNETTTSET